MTLVRILVLILDVSAFALFFIGGRLLGRLHNRVEAVEQRGEKMAKAFEVALQNLVKWKNAHEVVQRLQSSRIDMLERRVATQLGWTEPCGHPEPEHEETRPDNVAPSDFPPPTPPKSAA